MSKRAKEAALKAYPIKGEWVGNQYGEWDNDINRPKRNAFLQGYEQAEKDLAMSYPLPEDTVLLKKGVEEGRRLEKDDLALTWQDMAKIDAIILDVNNEFAVDYSKEIDRQKFYKEVLKRFKEVNK